MANEMNFTKAAIEALTTPAPGQRDTYLDTKTEGLQVRVTPSGIKTFSVFRRVKGGRPERVTIGPFPSVTVEQARKKAADINAMLVSGQSPSAGARSSKDEITLADLFDDFLKNRRSRRGAYLSEATKRDYKSSFDLYLGKLSNRKLSTIKKTDLAAIHTRLGREHQPRANRLIAMASSLFSHAESRKLFVGQSPTKGIQKFPENSRDRFLYPDELPQFFKAVVDEENETIRDYVLLSLLTGARRSNVLSMRWQDVNLDRGEWRLLTTKNGTPQTVTLSPEAVQIIASRKPAEPANPEKPAVFVFPGIGKAGHLAEPKKGWKRILERAGIDNLRIHDLRRTLGSWQAKSGASLAIIGKSLNHKTTSTTAIYARLDLDPVRESVNRATDAMLTAAGLKDGADVVKLTRKSV